MCSISPLRTLPSAPGAYSAISRGRHSKTGLSLQVFRKTHTPLSRSTSPAWCRRRSMLKRLTNEARFALNIETTGPLLIKSGHATLTGPDMTPVITFRHGGPQYYIPGSSLKGVFRSHLEKVIRTLRPDDVMVADPFQRANQADQACGAWFEQRKRANEVLDNATVYADSDPASRLFGSTFFIGRISIGDGYMF